jgi:hypothetical protein
MAAPSGNNNQWQNNGNNGNGNCCGAILEYILQKTIKNKTVKKVFYEFLVKS